MTNSIVRDAIIRIINPQGEIVMEDNNIGKYSKVRDIVAWDRKGTGVDELVMLETENLGNNSLT